MSTSVPNMRSGCEAMSGCSGFAISGCDVMRGCCVAGCGNRCGCEVG